MANRQGDVAPLPVRTLAWLGLAAPALAVIIQLKVRIVSGGYHVVGTTDVSLQRTGGRLEEVVKQIEGDIEDILLWPQNETSDTLSGTAVCRALRTLTCTFQTFPS